MITQLEGELVGSGVDWIDLKLVGITVRVFVPENTVDGRNLTDGLLRVYTVFVIKDDSPILYGFKDSETRSVFDSLNKVGGIGPKLALSILSKFDYNSLTVAVESGDVDSLSFFSAAAAGVKISSNRDQRQGIVTVMWGIVGVEGARNI